MKLSDKIYFRWTWAAGWPNGGFWSGALRRVENSDGTPYMCRAKFGTK